MECLEHRPIVVQLSQRRIESNEESVVDSRVTNIVTDSCDNEGQCVKGTYRLGYEILRVTA